MWIAAFVFGLLGSFHCVGMCGPIAFMLPVNRSNTYLRILQMGLYHLGRLLAYGIIGLAFGLVGKSLYLFGFQQQLSIIMGILMILAVLIPYKKFSKYNGSATIFKYISKIKSALGTALKKKTPETFLTIGFLNGLLPCGLVYMAVFAAVVSGNALSGSLYMVFFGLGTIPLMTSAMFLSQFFTVATRQKIQKAIPVFVVIVGVLFIIRGLGLGIPYLSPAPVYDLVSSSMDCH